MRFLAVTTLILMAAPAFAHSSRGYGSPAHEGGWNSSSAPGQWTCESYNGRGQRFYSTEADEYEAAREAVQNCLQATVLGDCEPANCRADYAKGY